MITTFISRRDRKTGRGQGTRTRQSKRGLQTVKLSGGEFYGLAASRTPSLL